LCPDIVDKATIPRHATPVRTKHFHKQVDRLEVGQLVIVRVDADAEEQPGVAAVHDLVVPELRDERSAARRHFIQRNEAERTWGRGVKREEWIVDSEL
jgi:hypothetical protein